MMGYGGFMGGGFSALGGVTWLVALIDLMLVGIWLWKKISEK